MDQKICIYSQDFLEFIWALTLFEPFAQCSSLGWISVLWVWTHHCLMTCLSTDSPVPPSPPSPPTPFPTTLTISPAHSHSVSLHSGALRNLSHGNYPGISEPWRHLTRGRRGKKKPQRNEKKQKEFRNKSCLKGRFLWMRTFNTLWCTGVSGGAPARVFVFNEQRLPSQPHNPSQSCRSRRHQGEEEDFGALDLLLFLYLLILLV